MSHNGNYTPTLDVLAAHYCNDRSADNYEERMAYEAKRRVEFDRAIAKVRAEAIVESETHVTELVERNRRLANQIVGYQSRVNDSLSAVIKNAKAEAVREAADALEGGAYKAFTVIEENRMEERHYIVGVLRNRADKLVTE